MKSADPFIRALQDLMVADRDYMRHVAWYKANPVRLREGHGLSLRNLPGDQTRWSPGNALST